MYGFFFVLFFSKIFMQYLKFVVLLCFVLPSFFCVKELGHKADVHFVLLQSLLCVYKHKDVE